MYPIHVNNIGIHYVSVYTHCDACTENLNCIKLNGKTPSGKQEITIVTHTARQTRKGGFSIGF